MLCAHCATPVPDQASFCYSCGSVVSDAEEVAAFGELTESSFEDIEEQLRAATAGEYEIERLIGRGGMALVYLAREVHLARHVAIKVLPPALTFGHGVERFKREARTAAALDHPHIIPIYRVSQGGSLFWYAMKYLEGESLEQRLRNHVSLTLPDTIRILSQVAEALDYAHHHQVVHRDMKPANVMLDLGERVTVTDFGIAKALSDGKLTASGSVVGTPNFMSPEQGMGMMVTGASDQYAVGIMAYRMLAGHVPFEGDSALDVLHKHCTATPPPLAAAVPGLPPGVHLAVHRALDKSPEHRFATVSAFVQAMRDAHAMTAVPPGADESAATVLVSERATPAPRSGTAPLRLGKTPSSGGGSRRYTGGRPSATGERRRHSAGDRPVARDKYPVRSSAPPRPTPSEWDPYEVEAPPEPLPGGHHERSSGERGVDRNRRAPRQDEWPARELDEHPVRRSGEGRGARSSGDREPARDVHVRPPLDEWAPEAERDEWEPEDAYERAAYTSGERLRLSGEQRRAVWDESPRHSYPGIAPKRRAKRRRRLPVPLVVGLAATFGGGAGAAALLTWDAVAPEKGILVVENLPPGASLLVDAEPVERQVIRLKPGLHEIEVLAPGMESHRETVTITPNATLRIEAPARPRDPPPTP